MLLQRERTSSLYAGSFCFPLPFPSPLSWRVEERNLFFLIICRQRQKKNPSQTLLACPAFPAKQGRARRVKESWEGRREKKSTVRFTHPYRKRRTHTHKIEHRRRRGTRAGWTHAIRASHSLSLSSSPFHTARNSTLRRLSPSVRPTDSRDWAAKKRKEEERGRSAKPGKENLCLIDGENLANHSLH